MNLSEMLSRFGEVEEMADGFLVHCPSHADSHPSLRIGVSDKVLLKCRAGCQTGDVLKALDLSWADLMTMHIDIAPRTRAVSTDAPASPAATAALAQQLDEYADAMTDEVRQYAMDRFGLTEAQVSAFGLGAWDDDGVMRLVVPFAEPSGKIAGHQARALDKNAKVRWKGPRTPADGGSWGKLGWFAGSDETGWTEVIITEGPGDALTAAGLGYDAIAVRGAALAKNDEVVRQIAQMVGSRKAVIAGDGDSAGREFASTLTNALHRLDVQAVVLPVPDDEDLSSWREADPSGSAIIEAVATSHRHIPSTAYLRELSEEEYPLSDVGAARWIRDYIRRSGSDVRWTPEAGYFLVESGVWRKDELDAVYAYTQEAFEVMQTLAKGFLDAAMAEDDEDRATEAKRRLKHAQRYSNTVPMEAAMKQLRVLRDVATRFSEFDTNPHLLACRNGVVDLRTGKLLDHNPAFMLTRLIGINYNPEAKAERWEQFLVEVFPNHEDMPAYMKRLVGYGITGNTDEQCFAVHWGTGANGKSVFTDTLTYTFRDITVTTPFSTFEARQSGGIPNDVAALKGARLVMASEGEADKPMAEAMLKRLTGRDAISARFMRQEFFEFYPTFLLNMATNNKPRFKGQDEGLWRRVKLIPWERYFAPHERDHRLEQKLRAEAEGILAWAVAGAVEWYENGLGDPKTVIDATKEYRENSDALDGFIPGVFERTSDIEEGVLAQDLYDAYLSWADDENLSQREIWTRRFFYTALEERGFKKVRRTQGRVFLGLKRL